MEEVAMSSAFESVRPHFKALARVGYYKAIPPLSGRKLFMHNFYRTIMFILVLTYNIQHVIRVIQVRHSTDQVVDILFILLTTLNTLCKQLAFNLRTKRLDDIFSVLNGELFKRREIYHKVLLKKNAVMMSRLLTFYHSAVLSCAAMWTVFPLVNRALGEEVEFTGYIPFQTTDSLLFAIALSHMSILITIQAYANATLDCTIVALYAEAKTQIQVLRYDFEQLLNLNSEDLSTELNMRNQYNRYTGILVLHDNKELRRRFISCAERYKYIVWFVKEIESIFSEAMIFQFLVMAWVICMTVYKIIGLYILSAEFVSMAMYLACMLAQFFIYCYFGTQLKVESDFVNRSIYCSNWLASSPKFRRLLLGMMQNSFRALAPTTAYVIPMSLDTYISVLKFSYTLFTFLTRK